MSVSAIVYDKGATTLDLSHLTSWCAFVVRWLDNRRRMAKGRQVGILLNNADAQIPLDILYRAKDCAVEAYGSRIPLAVLLRMKAIIENQPHPCAAR